MEKFRFGIFMQRWLVPGATDVPLSVYGRPPPLEAGSSGPRAKKSHENTLTGATEIQWLGGLFVRYTRPIRTICFLQKNSSLAFPFSRPMTLLVYDTLGRMFVVDCSGTSARLVSSKSRCVLIRPFITSLACVCLVHQASFHGVL